MEFMDRRNRSLLVQFWLTVESFKNPLESVDSEVSEDENEAIKIQTPSNTINEDISMINDLYFTGLDSNSALRCISSRYVDSVRDFISRVTPPTSADQQKVRRSVLLAQRQVEKAMGTDFEGFERSDLWFRAIGDSDFRVPDNRASNAQQLPSPSPVPLLISPISPIHSSKTSAGKIVHHSPITFQRSASAGSSHSLQRSRSSDRALPSNIEVLMSPILDAKIGNARAPLFDDPEDAAQRKEEERMAAIKAALTDIIALEKDPAQGDLFAVLDDKINTSVPRATPNIKHSMFDDEDASEGDDNDNEMDESLGDHQAQYQLPAPGDLQLSREIDRLGQHISHLQDQDAILDSLIRKAELTGDGQELKLLHKSKSSMTRELRQLKFQKLQYEQQESTNRLYSDRTRISITSSTTGEEGGKTVVRYLVEVQLLGPDGSFVSGWVIARRYNEFLNMHNKLKDKYASVRSLDFPGKRLVASLSGSFVDTRKIALEKYLQV